jgi:hypothetical protein
MSTSFILEAYMAKAGVHNRFGWRAKFLVLDLCRVKLFLPSRFGRPKNFSSLRADLFLIIRYFFLDLYTTFFYFLARFSFMFLTLAHHNTSFSLSAELDDLFLHALAGHLLGLRGPLSGPWATGWEPLG